MGADDSFPAEFFFQDCLRLWKFYFCYYQWFDRMIGTNDALYISLLWWRSMLLMLRIISYYLIFLPHNLIYFYQQLLWRHINSCEKYVSFVPRNSLIFLFLFFCIYFRIFFNRSLLFLYLYFKVLYLFRFLVVRYMT